MTAINATTARKNLYKCISDVNEYSEPLTITNSRGKNAVLIGEDDWRAIEETVYLHTIPGMAESILAADDEPVGTGTVYDPEESW